MKPTRFLSGPERDIFNTLQTAVRTRSPCPTNTDLARRHAMGHSSVVKHLNSMVDKGWIAIEANDLTRTITISTTGAKTEPGRTFIKKPPPPGKVMEAPRLESRPPPRDPCFHCQVPRDRHDENGCRRWYGGAL